MAKNGALWRPDGIIIIFYVSILDFMLQVDHKTQPTWQVNTRIKQ